MSKPESTHRIVLVAISVVASAFFGCGGASPTPDLVWGRKGVQRGDFSRPRAIAIGSGDRVAIVDFTARIQIWDGDGRYIGPTWTTPDFRNGRPSGLSIDRDGNIIVCDSHYHCVRTYDWQGIELKVMGGETGSHPGEFGYISDCVQDQDGFYYVSEFSINDRITKLDANGKVVACWGERGDKPMQFSRIRALAISPDNQLVVADACNHRIQVLSRDGSFVRIIGSRGDGLGQLSYPYDVAFDADGSMYVAEYGNHRVQKFSNEGKPLAVWGQPGRGPGQLHSPWALAVDGQGRIHVVDTENHRVQRIRM